MFYKKNIKKKKIQTHYHSEHDLVITYKLAFNNIWFIFENFKFSIEPSFQSNPTIEPWKVLLASFSFSFPLTPLPSLMGVFNFLRDKVVILFSLLVCVSYSPTLK